MEVPADRNALVSENENWKNTEDFLTILPLDLKCEIFSNVDPETVISARQISKVWLCILLQDAIWKRIAEKIYGVYKKDDSVSTWVGFYKYLKQR